MLYAKHSASNEQRVTSNESGVTLIELILGLVIFAIIVPGIILILSKGMETFFFEREELAVQSDIRSVMDRMSDKLRQATSVTTAKKTNIVFEPDSRRYYYRNKNVYDGEGNQLNSQGIEVIDFSFSYYGDDMVNPLSPVVASEVKAVGIRMEFKANDNPALELESWVLMRNLL